MRSLVLLGQSHGRRTRALQEALDRLGLPAAEVVPWSAVLGGDPLPLTPRTTLRIDTPGMDLDTHRRLLALGAQDMVGEHAEALDAEAALSLPADGSGLRYVRQHHLGFLRALRQIDGALLASGADTTHPPGDIALMCDKALCHQAFVEAGLRVAERLEAEDPGSLRDQMDAQGVHRAFVKPRHGSSAAGIAAFERHHGEERLITTLVLGPEGPYTSLRLRETTRRADIDAILGWIFAEGAHVERWLPKAGLGAREFDLRVVVIAGRACHTVVRVSRDDQPMTNLHLGSKRGDLDATRRSLGEGVWGQTMRLCEAAAACFPRSLCLGVDVMIVPERGPTLIEVNAFGDLLPGILWEGSDTYEAQLRALFFSEGGL